MAVEYFVRSMFANAIGLELFEAHTNDGVTLAEAIKNNRYRDAAELIRNHSNNWNDEIIDGKTLLLYCLTDPQPDLHLAILIARRMVKQMESRSEKDCNQLRLYLLAEVGTAEHGRMTAMHLAALSGWDDFITQLIRCSVDINYRVGVTKFTPLCYAVIGGHESTITLLIQNGAHFNPSIIATLAVSSDNAKQVINTISATIKSMQEETNDRRANEQSQCSLLYRLCQPLRQYMIQAQCSFPTNEQTNVEKWKTTEKYILHAAVQLNKWDLLTCLDFDERINSELNQCLQASIASGCHDGIEQLLCLGADINHRDANGNTPLINIMIWGKINYKNDSRNAVKWESLLDQVKQYLLHKDADPTLTNYEGQSFLHFLIQLWNHPSDYVKQKAHEIAQRLDENSRKQLLLCAADLDDFNLLTVIFFDVLAGEINYIFYVDGKGDNIFHHLANLRESTLISVLSHPDEELNEFENEMKNLLNRSHLQRYANIMFATPLHVACKKGNVAALKYFVEVARVGVWPENVNEPTTTILHCLADCKNKNRAVSCLSWLLKHSFLDVQVLLNLQDRDGNTPLHLAARNQNMALIWLLYNGNPNVINRQYLTTYGEALMTGNDKFFMKFIECFENCNSSLLLHFLDTCIEGKPLLHYAVEYTSENVLRYLIKKGADVTMKDAQGNTALHYIALLLINKPQDMEKLKKKADAIVEEATRSNRLHIPTNDILDSSDVRFYLTRCILNDNGYSVLTFAGSLGASAYLEYLMTPIVKTDMSSERLKSKATYDITFLMPICSTWLGTNTNNSLGDMTLYKAMSNSDFVDKEMTILFDKTPMTNLLQIYLRSYWWFYSLLLAIHVGWMSRFTYFSLSEFHSISYSIDPVDIKMLIFLLIWPVLLVALRMNNIGYLPQRMAQQIVKMRKIPRAVIIVSGLKVGLHSLLLLSAIVLLAMCFYVPLALYNLKREKCSWFNSFSLLLFCASFLITAVYVCINLIIGKMMKKVRKLYIIVFIVIVFLFAAINLTLFFGINYTIFNDCSSLTDKSANVFQPNATATDEQTIDESSERSAYKELQGLSYIHVFFMIGNFVLTFGIICMLLQILMPNLHKLFNCFSLAINSIVNNSSLYWSYLFLLSMLAWFSSVTNILKHEYHVYFLALAYIFGWTHTLHFTRAFKSMHLFSSILWNIISQDLTKFLIVYIFIVGGFSVAIHVLSLDFEYSPTEQPSFWETLFIALKTMLGIADILDSKDDEMPFNYTGAMLKITYICFLIISNIVLLNVLIAMMMQTYKGAYRAENKLWHYEAFTEVQQFPWLVRFFIEYVGDTKARPSSVGQKTVGGFTMLTLTVKDENKSTNN